MGPDASRLAASRVKSRAKPAPSYVQGGQHLARSLKVVFMADEWGEEQSEGYSDDYGPVLALNYSDVLVLADDANTDHLAEVSPLPPSPASPGYLGLRYNDVLGHSHKTRFRLLFGRSPLDYATMLAAADAIAPYLAAAIPNVLRVEGFFTQDSDGHSLLDSLLSQSYPGLRSTGGVDMWSFSWTLTGRTVAIDPDALPGNEMTRIFPRHYAMPPIGAKGFPVSTDAAVLNYAAALATSTVCWGDYRGRKAGIRPVAPIQANAAVQRRMGW